MNKHEDKTPDCENELWFVLLRNSSTVLSDGSTRVDSGPRDLWHFIKHLHARRPNPTPSFPHLGHVLSARERCVKMIKPNRKPVHRREYKGVRTWYWESFDLFWWRSLMSFKSLSWHFIHSQFLQGKSFPVSSPRHLSPPSESERITSASASPRLGSRTRKPEPRVSSGRPESCGSAGSARARRCRICSTHSFISLIWKEIKARARFQFLTSARTNISRNVGYVFFLFFVF